MSLKVFTVKMPAKVMRTISVSARSAAGRVFPLSASFLR
jgi:hypothetical protein